MNITEEELRQHLNNMWDVGWNQALLHLWCMNYVKWSDIKHLLET